MTMQEHQLAIECRQASETLGRLIEALDATPAAGAVERGPMLTDLGRCLRRMNRLAAAAMKPAALGILGPPGSGKSALARMLARGSAHPTPDEPLDIQLDASLPAADLAMHLAPHLPASLGIVLRLTAKAPSAPPLFPFPTQLLAAPDIVKILARAYLSSGRSRADPIPGATEIRDLAVEAGRHLRLFPVSGLEADQVADIRDYLERTFYFDPRVRALAATGYWEQLAALASHLPDEARADLLEPLWGMAPRYRELYVALSCALGSIEHAAEVFCPLEAVADFDQATRKFRPRADSIAAAGTALVKGASAETVMLRTRLGHFAGLGRGDLAALAAEVRLCVGGDISALLEDVQILEFPALEPRPLTAGGRKGEGKGADEVAALFRRAKREYLHEAYVRDHELTALLVCFDPARTSIDPHAGYVADWVDLAQGSEPRVREEGRTGLFVAAIRSEPQHAAAPARAKGDPWLERLGKALAERFGRVHEWPREWAPDQPFDNVFLLRALAPGASEPLALVREDDTIERRLALLAPDANSAQARFLAEPTVKAHVHDPARSWSDAQASPDGGVGYLADRIADACDGLARHRQVSLGLRDIKARLRSVLLRHLPVIEGSRMLDWRLRDARVVVSRQRRDAGRRRFGFLLDTLQVPETELREVFRRLEKAPRVEGGEVPAATPVPSAVQAAAVIDYWLDRMRALLLCRESEAALALPRTVVGHIVDELCVAARRLDLVGMLASRLGWAVCDRMPIDQRVGRSAMLAAATLASFVTTLRLDDSLTRGGSRLRAEGRAGTKVARKTAQSATTWLSGTDEQWRLAFADLVRENVLTPIPRGDGLRVEQIRDFLTSLGIGGAWEFGA